MRLALTQLLFVGLGLGRQFSAVASCNFKMIMKLEMSFFYCVW